MAADALRFADLGEFDEERIAAALRPYPLRRALLYLSLCLLWAIPGVVERDPWKPTETEIAAVVKHATQSLPLAPQLAGEFYPQAPLYIWAAAAAAKIGGWFGLEIHEGARLVNLAALFAAFAALGFAVGIRHGARAGWLAPVAAVGLTGLLVGGHLLDPAVFAFAGGSFVLFGVLLTTKAAFAGGAVFGAGCGFLFLSGGFGGLIPAAALLLLPLLSKRWRGVHTLAGFAAAPVFAAPLLLIWPLLLYYRAPDAYAAWLAAEAARWQGWDAAPRGLAQFVKTGLWAAWPAWALAGLLLVGEIRRGVFRDLETAPCLLFFAAAALVFVLSGGRGESDLLIALPPLVMIAAAAAARLARNRVIALDWFALLVVGVFFVGGQWLALFAAQFGMGEWIRDLIPAAAANPPGGGAIAAAAALTLGWMLLAAKFGYSNERAIVNWSCGLALVWALFALLWMDAVDAGKSYRNLAGAVAAEVAPGECVTMRGLSGSHIGQLYYFADLTPAPAGAACAWLLVQQGGAAVDDSQWRAQLVRGRFEGDDEVFALHRRF